MFSKYLPFAGLMQGNFWGFWIAVLNVVLIPVANIVIWLLFLLTRKRVFIKIGKVTSVLLLITIIDRGIFYYNKEFYNELFTINETVYSNNYNEKYFRGIEIGMTQREVKTILGEPLKYYRSSGREIWSYSSPGGKYENYRVRKVIFDGDRKVSGKIKKFNIAFD